MSTYTILTTNVAPELKWLHTRMPVILSDEGVTRWLSSEKFEHLQDLLVPYRVGDLTWHPVDKKVGSMQFQSEDCAKKVDIKHAGDIKSFFGVKKEKQDPDAAKVSPVKPFKTEVSPVKTESDGAGSAAKSPAKSLPGFVPASSLLTKRTASPPPAASPPRKRSQPSKLKSPSGPKQSSLDFFFAKSSNK